MALILFKWFWLTLFSGPSVVSHPVFVSVTEIEHNQKEKTLEISCKIFTDDFEKTLRKTTRTKVDLLNPAVKSNMNSLVSAYIKQHLHLQVDGKAVEINFLGYEQKEEGIISFFQADNIASVHNLTISNDILYEYSDQQMGLLQVTVNGTRKNARLGNPEKKTVFSF